MDVLSGYYAPGNNGLIIMNIKIIQAERKHIKDIWVFIKKAYKRMADYKIPDRWNWEFLLNPFWNNKEKLPIWIALDNNKIVGQNCGMIVPLKTGNKIINAAWSVDTIVLPEYRGLGIGTKLQKASGEYYDVFMSLSMSKVNRIVKEKIGSVSLTPVPVFWKFLKINSIFLNKFLFVKTINYPFLRKIYNVICGIFKIHFILPLFLNFCILILNIIKRSKKKKQKTKIYKIKKFDETIDVLWEHTEKKYNIIVKRTHEYLNWKYVNQPGMNYSIYLAKQDNIIKGYIVFRKNSKEELEFGMITDLYTAEDDTDTMDDLIIFAEKYFKNLKNTVSIIECATNGTHIQSRFLKKNYFKVNEYVPMFYSKDKNISKNIINNKWFLNKGDHDWDRINPVFMVKQQ